MAHQFPYLVTVAHCRKCGDSKVHRRGSNRGGRRRGSSSELMACTSCGTKRKP